MLKDNHKKFSFLYIYIICHIYIISCYSRCYFLYTHIWVDMFYFEQYELHLLACAVERLNKDIVLFCKVWVCILLCRKNHPCTLYIKANTMSLPRMNGILWDECKLLLLIVLLRISQLLHKETFYAVLFICSMFVLVLIFSYYIFK